MPFINKFLSHIQSKQGFAKSSRFDVNIPIPIYVSKYVSTSLLDSLLNLGGTVQDIAGDAINNALGRGNDSVPGGNATFSRYLSLQCEAAELPGRSLVTQDIKIYGPTYKVPYQTQYQEISLTFLCTNDFYERKFFDRWLECIHPSDTNNLRYPKGLNGGVGDGYMTDITISQYDESTTQIYRLKLNDAFPTTIASQQLTWSDDTFHRLQVQFAYQKYTVLYEPITDIGSTIAGVGTGIVGTVRGL